MRSCGPMYPAGHYANLSAVRGDGGVWHPPSPETAAQQAAPPPATHATQRGSCVGRGFTLRRGDSFTWIHSLCRIHNARRGRVRYSTREIDPNGRPCAERREKRCHANEKGGRTKPVHNTYMGGRGAARRRHWTCELNAIGCAVAMHGRMCIHPAGLKRRCQSGHPHPQRPRP